MPNWPLQTLGTAAPAAQAPFPEETALVWNLSLEDIESHTGRVLQRASSPVAALGSSKCSFNTDHVLYSKLRPYLNKVVVPDAAGVGTSELIPLRPRKDLLDRDFLAWYLRSPAFLEFSKLNTRGANLPRIAMDALWAHQVPTPALGEQRRIATRVREAMVRVDELRTLRGDLMREVIVVRAAAVTEAIATLRARHREASIGELVGSGPGLMASGPFGSQLKHGDFVAAGTLVIGIANVQRDRFDPVRKWMVDDATLARLGRYRVRPADMLVTIMGTVGRTCVVPDDIGDAVTSKHVYRIRFTSGRVLPRFVSIAINYDRETVRRLHGEAIGGVMPGLNAGKLRELRLPVPPLDEQQRLIETVDRLARLAEIEAQAGTTPETHLASSILRRAFAGEL